MGQFVQRPGEAPVWAEDADLDRMLTSGYQPVDASTVGEQVTQEDRGQGGVGGAILAGASSLASGATMGLSDLLHVTEGGRKDVAAARAAHPVVSTGANVVGMVAPALLSGGATAPESLALAGADAGEALGARGALQALAESMPVTAATRTGGAVSDLVGGGLTGRVLGGAAEGALFGAGQGVSDVGLSDDPLTAENIIGHVSSNALVGAGLGGGLSLLGEGLGRALDRAGNAVREAQAARAVLSSVPDDLAAMDEPQLADEMTKAKAEHANDVIRERQSLEQLRRAQRSDVVGQVQDLHDELATTSPVSLAVGEGANDAAKVWEVDGVKQAQTQLAQSYESLRNALKDPDGLARNPAPLFKPMRQRLDALQTIDDQMDELRARLVDHPLGAGLDAVPDAIKQTRSQLDALEALAPKAEEGSPLPLLGPNGQPVMPTRLRLLEAGPSERMKAVTAAQDALAKGKELGVVGQRVKSIAETTAAGLAHLIPVPGAAFGAHWLGERAGAAVEWLSRKLGSTATKAQEATAGHLDRFLSTASMAGKTIKGPATATATKVLGGVRFAPPSDTVAPSGDSLRDLFRARSAELRQQTAFAPDGSVQVTPDARQRIAATFDGLRGVAPQLADKLETAAVARVAYLSSKLPRKQDTRELRFGPDTWAPSDHEIREYANTVRGAEHPESVEERLAHGVMTPEEADAYRTVYPARFAALQRAITEAAPRLSKTLPMQKRLALSVFTGVPLVATLEPNVLSVIQASFAVEPNSNGGTQAPRAVPQFGSRGTPKDVDKPTPSQERQL